MSQDQRISGSKCPCTDILNIRCFSKWEYVQLEDCGMCTWCHSVSHKFQVAVMNERKGIVLWKTCFRYSLFSCMLTCLKPSGHPHSFNQMTLLQPTLYYSFWQKQIYIKTVTVAVVWIWKQSICHCFSLAPTTWLAMDRWQRHLPGSCAPVPWPGGKCRIDTPGWIRVSRGHFLSSLSVHTHKRTRQPPQVLWNHRHLKEIIVPLWVLSVHYPVAPFSLCVCLSLCIQCVCLRVQLHFHFINKIFVFG